MCSADASAVRTLPSFLPPAADLISDPAGVALLSSLREIPVSTSLLPIPITTVHATCDTSSPPSALPTVVFLHGFDSNALEFRTLLPLLCPHARVFAPDLLGWGLTEKPSRIPYDPSARREHLRAYIASVAQGQSVTLLGASIGGAVAIDFALVHPSLVSSLVLIDAQAYQDRPRSALLNLLPFLAHVGADVLRSTWLRRTALNMSYANQKFCTEDALRMGALHVATDGWKEAAVDFILGEGYCVSGQVGLVKAPTLVLWGRRDRILPVENAQRFADDIPGATVVVIDECGHSPHIEKAEVTAGHILDFLEKKVGSHPVEGIEEVVAEAGVEAKQKK